MLLYYNKDNWNECQVPISAMLDSNYLKTSSEYNLSRAHFSRTGSVCLYFKNTK